jgi:hypothetical protein
MGLFGAHVAIQVLEQQPHQVEFVWLAGCAQDSKRITTRAPDPLRLAPRHSDPSEERTPTLVMLRLSSHARR